MTRPATVSHPGYFSILFIKMVLTVADPYLEAGRKFLCLMPIFELDYESYRVHFPEMCQCIVLKLGYFSPLVLHLLIHSKVFYFVRMGDSLKSFKIKDYKLITCYCVSFSDTYCFTVVTFRCVTPSLMTVRAPVTLKLTTITASTVCMTNSKYIVYN